MPTGIYKHKGKWNKILTKKFLILEYSKKQIPPPQIAEEIGCSSVTIRNYLKIHKIRIRPIKFYLIGKKHPRYKDGRTFRNYSCKICDKGIGNTSALYGSGLCRSCCRKEFFKNPQNHPKYIDGRTNKKYKCIDCGKRISSDSGIYGGNRCNSCAKIGKKNPAYCHGKGYFPYPSGWTKTFKKQIRFRDNYTCQKCNIEEKEYKLVRGRVLDIHHIDYNKNNLDPNNLISLCNNCNSKVNFNRDYWLVYFSNKLKEIRL